MPISIIHIIIEPKKNSIKEICLQSENYFEKTSPKPYNFITGIDLLYKIFSLINSRISFIKLIMVNLH